MRKFLKWLAVGLAAVLVVLIAAVWLTTFHPGDVEAADVTCPEDAPVVGDQPLRVMNWNVQYLAGKDYVFWYDLLDESGPDDRPSAAAISTTLDDVVRVIEAENPDVILLQELDDGAARTDREDQRLRLQAALDGAYPCSAEAFYWKASFVPHPRVMGSVGMELVTLSKYRIDDATRYQLAEMPADPLTRQFNLKRAVLEARLPTASGDEVVFFNTHLDAFAQGNDTMQRQVSEVNRILAAEASPWVIGGDFNLLPPGRQFDDLPAGQQAYYEPDSELAVLYDRYAAVPALEDANGVARAAWYTHFPNDPAVTGPDRTIDYVFAGAGAALTNPTVRSTDTTGISDHLPLLVDVTIE